MNKKLLFMIRVSLRNLLSYSKALCIQNVSVSLRYAGNDIRPIRNMIPKVHIFLYA